MSCTQCTAKQEPDFPDFATWYRRELEASPSFWATMESLEEQYYDRDSNPISYPRWRWLCARDQGYRIVKHWHRGDELVSTVLLGVDHSHPEGPLSIFETMVFNVEGWKNEMCRYGTIAQAEFGHVDVVAAVESGQTYNEWRHELA